jgi:hypothetical protein
MTKLALIALLLAPIMAWAQAPSEKYTGGTSTLHLVRPPECPVGWSIQPIPSTPSIGVCQPDKKPVARNYCLLVVTRDATVKITHGLTRYEAEFARNRLLGLPATPAEKSKAAREAAEAAREDARALAAAPICAPEGATQAQHDAWSKGHPNSTGCRRLEYGKWQWGWESFSGLTFSDGSASTVHMTSPNDIMTAEIFIEPPK